MWGKSHKGRTIQVIAASAAKKRWFTFITENTPEVQVSSVKFVPANLSIFKAAKAVLTYIETTALKAKARKASMCAQSCTHTQTLIHYQAGHHESCRKLALFEFPVHPCDRSPLFLETEDRVHTHTHKHPPTPSAHTQTFLCVAAVVYSMPTALRQQSFILIPFTLSSASPFFVTVHRG